MLLKIFIFELVFGFEEFKLCLDGRLAFDVKIGGFQRIEEFFEMLWS
jgi:hypothetical protein